MMRTNLERILGRATLITNEHGQQTYRYDDGRTEIIAGWNRATNVQVGDTGVLVYRTGPSWGLPFFVKDVKGGGDDDTRRIT